MSCMIHYRRNCTKVRTSVTFAAILLGLAWCVTTDADEELVWLEAEQFSEHGGWVIDPQFIDQMGSSYLLAGGFGNPVEDATTSVTINQSGKYRLWVRTKDWFPKHHPGTFQLVLNAKTVEHIFGRSGRSGWQWEDGGVHRLSGDVRIRLHDLSGYYGRCDVVVLARDVNWVPPSDVRAIESLRVAHGGLSPQIQDLPKYDVVVVGGGLAGCTAAVAATRNGMHVALIQNRPVLGGNASNEIFVPPVGAWPSVFRNKYPLDPRETGFIEEYRTAGNQRISEGKLYWKRLARFVGQEPDLDLYLNTHATGVEMEAGSDHRIAAVLARDVCTGKRMRFCGAMFIDCTGDAVVGVAAGAEYRHGKESKAMHGEPWAPDEPSRHTMGNGLKYFAVHTDEPQPYVAPPWIYHFPSCDDFGPSRHPRLPTESEIEYQWRIELGGLRDTYADAEEIRDDLLRLIFGLWDHTKNHCPRYSEQAANCRLAWVGYVAGKRENRRLMGDYILTQNDIGQQRMFEDRVAFGAWSVDDHYSAGFFHDGPAGRHFDTSEHHYKGVPFTIPFRCLYSKNIDNLMMAGRDISATHLGLSNTRVMLTCAILGHAAGTGAALCVKHNTTPRDIYEHYILELQQQLLKEGAPVLDMPNLDPDDLARRATATASSEGVHESGDPTVAANVINGLARATGSRGEEITNAWAPDARESGPHWVELQWDTPIDMNMVHVSFQTVSRAPRWFAVDGWSQGKWVRLAEVPQNRHRRHVLGLDRVTLSKLRVTMNDFAAISEIRVYSEPKEVVESARRAHRTMRLPDEGPWFPWPEPASSLKLDGIVLDANDAEQHGDWVPSTWEGPYVGDGYLHDGDTGKGTKSIRFTMDNVPPGYYEVRFAYRDFRNRASNTTVTITARNATKTITVNQRRPPPIDRLFYSLGKYHLDASSFVEINNGGTDGYVVVDAIQLLPVGSVAE